MSSRTFHEWGHLLGQEFGDQPSPSEQESSADMDDPVLPSSPDCSSESSCDQSDVSPSSSFFLPDPHQLNSPTSSSSSSRHPFVLSEQPDCPSSSSSALPRRTYTHSIRHRRSAPVTPPLVDLQETVIKRYCQQCCSKACTWKFPLDTCLDLTRRFHQMDNPASLQWLSTTLASAVRSSGQLSVPLKLTVKDVPVCHRAFRTLYGISTTKFYRALRVDGMAIPIHGNSLRLASAQGPPLRNKDCMILFLASFFDEIGDRMPNDMAIHVPMYMSITDLYALCIEDLKSKRQSVDKLPSYATFLALMELHFKHVKFPKKTRLGQCDFCTQIPALRQKCANARERSQLKSQISAHNLLVRLERLSFAERDERSQRFPEKYMHIAMDCPEMIWLPHLRPIAKSHSKYERMPLPAIGILNLSHHTKEYVYHLPVYKRNPNLYITSTFFHLCNKLSSISMERRPHTLWMQMDNCAKENKNRWFFAFCCLLIHWNWFRCVQLSFLPPGHSHSIVDQMFSTRQKQLEWNSVPSIPALVEFVNRIYGESPLKPKQSFLPKVYNWAGWMGPYVSDLEGHSGPHVFKFEKHANGQVAMMHKPWHSSTEDFQGDRRAPCTPIFLFANGVPPGYPPVMDPNPIDPLHLKDIREFFDWLPASASTWWTSFIGDPKPPANLVMNIPADIWQLQQLQLSESITHCETLPITISTNNVAVSNIRTSTHHVDPEAVMVPDILSEGMLALVVPTDSSGDRFWLCKIHHIKEQDPHIYKVRYFQQNPQSQTWKLMTGQQGSYGTVPHDAVILAGFSLTLTGHLRNSTLQQLHECLSCM